LHQKDVNPNVFDPFSWTNPGQIRQWTDISGQFTCEAKYVSFSDGVVRLQKADGRYVRVAMDKLSLTDQFLVEGLIATIAAK
jgi:hypothetical protein